MRRDRGSGKVIGGVDVQADSNSIEAVLRGWQEKGATVAVSCVGTRMSVAFTGKVRESRQGTWTVGNGRAGLLFDVRYATGGVGDPTVVPETVRRCVEADFVTSIELLAETGDEFWLGEVRGL